MPTTNPSGCVPSLVDFLLPFLTKTSCGQCLTGGCGGCVWRTCDAMCGIDSRGDDIPSAQAKALVVFTQVTVKNADAYAVAFKEWAVKTQESTPGVRALFSFMDKDKPLRALQLAWYDSPEVLAAVAKDEAVIAAYGPTAEDFTLVYGGHTPAVKTALEALIPGVTVNLALNGRGFLRDMASYGPGGTPYKNPPMIWVSKRFVKPGFQEANKKAFKKAGYLQYNNAHGFYGSYEFQAPDDADMTWSLRFFGDYHKGHIAHFPKVICSWIPARVLFTVLPTLAGAGVSGFPTAVAFSTKDDIEAACAWNAGNKAYTSYTWDEGLIGPMPNFMER